MNGDEIKKQTEEMLLKVPDLRSDILRMDYQIKTGSADKKIIQLRDKKVSELEFIIQVVSTLSEDNQQIICYKYFDKMKNIHIAKRLGVHPRTINRRINNGLLMDIGNNYLVIKL
ncbi:hypothetical protein GC105_06885 [Alkalibaculum sp. M08DMB]|uniref:RNA polymerase sigma factor 70 region 4 type 2 domain-containing protein n=1 Tax=Alkalibaculum sporogenes TaxID=2655001 RepID=A0A6A7K7V9_9FIRM|nr:sigma factor-like helix-turn-helix DNA-binding protein [Alkalibaculum sporogenes]MPW25510.1 hypothetical protein [Alkalibaculum sporogenes]